MTGQPRQDEAVRVINTAIMLPNQSPDHQSRVRDQSHPWRLDQLADVYVFPVSPDPAVMRSRFAAVIQRALDGARIQGLTDRQISDRTGVGSSTFHRWRVGNFITAPEIGKVTAFCEGLGVPVEPALRALGMDEERDDPAPPPAIPPIVRRILRGLNDPNVPEADKSFALEMLEMVATRITKSRSSGL